MSIMAQFIAPLPSFIKWQCYNARCGGFSTYVDVYRIAHNSLWRFDKTHADVFVENRAWRSTGKGADLLAVFVNSIAAPAYTSFDHLDANKLAFGPLLFDFEQSIAADKVIFVEFYRPAQSRLQWVGLLIKFMAVKAITS